jgi:hypothetical protein
LFRGAECDRLERLSVDGAPWQLSCVLEAIDASVDQPMRL